jgi:hypothetical protein
MSGRKRCAGAAGALLFGLLAVDGARAGDCYRCGPYAGCPKPSYSCVQYWAPTVHRVYACLCGPRISQYPPDRYPDIPPRSDVIPFRCQTASPQTMTELYSVPQREAARMLEEQPSAAPPATPEQMPAPAQK